jgi:hypothetical protein
MSSQWIKMAAAAVVAGAIGVGATGSDAEAGSMILGNSGWKASWDSSFDDAAHTFVTLTVLAETCDAVVLQKVAAFTDGPDEYGLIAPIEINFEQISANAVKKIVITSESVANNTGYDWSAFLFIIEDGTTGDPTKDVHYDMYDSFGDDDPFDISPFTNVNASGITALPQVLEFSGGVVADGTYWTPGVGAGAGEVVINANPSLTGRTRFVFKEQPIPIPLPAAAWMGLSGLACIAVPRVARRVRAAIA